MTTKSTILIYLLSITSNVLMAQKLVPVKPRILISTDIGGTDPDDNQSMTHFLMYSYMFKSKDSFLLPLMDTVRSRIFLI
jgi:hypothetical protein